jgi:hypothetical protein
VSLEIIACEKRFKHRLRELIPPSLDLSKAGPSHVEQIPIDFSLQALQVIASVHVIDQSIKDIAKEFRFTVEEVQEYYDKCGEMERTRLRFQKMRHELMSRFTDDDQK